MLLARRHAPAPTRRATSSPSRRSSKTHLAYVITGNADDRRDQPRRPARPVRRPRRAHRARARRPDRRRPGARRARLLPAALLADRPGRADCRRPRPWRGSTPTCARAARCCSTPATSSSARPRSTASPARRRSSACATCSPSLDIPPLEPVPADHVLTKAFYLLNDFPGRYAGGPLWVEATQNAEERADRPAQAGDGVSTILITENDFAARLGDRRRRQLPVPDGADRSAAARDGLPHRHQHRHVHADRQLQGRPGARAGAPRAAGAIAR